MYWDVYHIPWSARVRLLKPEPADLQCSSHELEIGDAKAAKIQGPLNLIPSN